MTRLEVGTRFAFEAHDETRQGGSMISTAPASNVLTGGTGARVVSETITVQTTGAPEFVDLTDRVAELVARTGVQHGIVCVFSQHTTAAIRVNEAEPLLLDDVADCLERLAPRDAQYRHNDFHVRTVNMTEDESPNGHSHCRHLLMGASESIPIVNGALALGRWQRVFLVELDHARQRDVIVQVVGLA